MNELHEADINPTNNDAFLGVVTQSTDGNPWSIVISVNGHPIKFEIDTGAEVSVTSKKAHCKIGHHTLHTSEKTLWGPSNNELSVRGQFTAKL